MSEIGVKNKIDRKEIIKVSRMKPVIKPTVPHKHEGYHELIFLFKGSGFHQIDADKIDLIVPVGFYLRPGQVHCWNFSEIPEGFVILFKEDALFEFPSTKNNLIKLQSSLSLTSKVDFFQLLEQFYKQYKSEGNPRILAAYLNLVLQQTFDFVESQPASLPADVADFYRFKALVEEKFAKVRNSAEYADMLNISNYRLNAICQAVVNKKATDIIKERVLMEARNYVTHTNLNLSEIANKLNFNDASNFNKFFKSRTGLTPLEYRGQLIG
jgi:AraC family transcriptional activator of pobA